MISLSSIVNAVTRLAFVLLSVTLFAWVLMPEHRPVFLGLTIGLAAGLFNFRYLSLKINQVSENAATPGGKRVNFGFLSRMCITLLAIMFAVRFEQVSMSFTIIGLFLVQVLALPVSIILNARAGK
ncbi:ATP synthase subunit I [Paenibacillus sp. TCA20]|uniref:ATP synthase subunit I n=1 Tax=Paenibacillus sp. TCA20 TaxID=1499968 RepID=UPI00064C4F16|nr:ATP synthase subunit I [Paenibacillus sp. TCA20]